MSDLYFDRLKITVSQNLSDPFDRYSVFQSNMLRRWCFWSGYDDSASFPQTFFHCLELPQVAVYHARTLLCFGAETTPLSSTVVEQVCVGPACYCVCFAAIVSASVDMLRQWVNDHFPQSVRVSSLGEASSLDWWAAHPEFDSSRLVCEGVNTARTLGDS